jgi:exopolyphosphatase/guanosine-5'-triphosphate,3'-diphosphate pyrophosphatase
MRQPLRLAAIDLGTNSFHMIIVELLSDMSFLMIDRAKDMIRIGDGSITTKTLNKEAMEKGVETLLRFRKLAEQRGVDSRHIIAFATSAIREARNGGEFMEVISSRVGIKTKIISGTEEARLIYLGVRRAINIGKRKALMIDAGGGSVEFMIGDQEKLFFSESKKIGVARTLERFVTTDPISERERKAIENYFTEELKSIAKEADAIGFDFAIASSGTAENIATMTLLEERGQEIEALNGNTFSRKGFQKLYDRLLKMKSAERKLVEGLDPKRSDLIVPGLILFDVAFRLFDLKSITISEHALREGIVVDYLSKHLEEFRLVHSVPDTRRRSVIELARRCQADETRSSHIAKLSLELFDKLATLHHLGSHERELLEYAAMLHNIGYFISPSSHHKHSQYIIQNGDLRGFTPDEIQIIGNAARYHRKSEPKTEHLGYQLLSAKNKHVVRVLASILRLTNAFDRSHRNNIAALKVRITDEKIYIKLISNSDAEIELWAALRMRDMFESVFGKSLVITAESIED